MVETCSVTAADCPCLAFPYIERTGRGFRPAVDGLFSFPLKIHLKGRCLPAGWGFFKISFALVIRERRFWQPAGQRIFLSLPTPPRFEICQTGQAVFSGFIYLLRVIFDFAKWTTKKQQIFFRLTAFTGRAGGGWYSVLNVRAGWLDNLGFIPLFFSYFLQYR